MTYYRSDNKKNATTGKWIVRRPDGIKRAYTDTRDEALALSADLNELRELRVLLAWTCGQLAESQACAMLGATPEQIKTWRDTCLRKAMGEK